MAPAPPLERQNIPTEFNIDAPGLLSAQVSGKAEVRLNGPVVMINGLTGMLGDGAFNGWASVDIASKPLVKLDLDFQRLNVANGANQGGSAAQPWSNATIDLNGLNYVDAQARISAAALNFGDARFAPAAIDVTLTSGVLKTQISNLGAYDGNANGDLTIDASTANPSFALRADLTGVRALPLLRVSPISTSSTARCKPRSACAPPATASARSWRACKAPRSSCSRTAPSRASTSPR